MKGSLYCLLVFVVFSQSRSSSLTGTCGWHTRVSHSENRIPPTITEVYCAQVGGPCGRGVFCKVRIFSKIRQIFRNFLYFLVHSIVCVIGSWLPKTSRGSRGSRPQKKYFDGDWLWLSKYASTKVPSNRQSLDAWQIILITTWQHPFPIMPTYFGVVFHLSNVNQECVLSNLSLITK